MQETRVPHPGLGRSLWEGNGNPLEYSCLGNPKGRRAFSLVQLFSRVRLFATQWTVTHQASLSITNSRSLLRLMAIESVMPSNHLSSVVPISSCPHSFPASGSFLVSQFFPSGGQSIGVSSSASVLPMNLQDWFPLRLTALIPLQSKGLSGVLSYTPVQNPHYYPVPLRVQQDTWVLKIR